ncbi:MAG: hypothetical protein AAGG02_07270 [Cyanobacteria bacterium P01_H01_bin.15]
MSVLLVVISPAIAINVASRVQSKRVKLAVDATASYIVGVQSGRVAAPPIATSGSVPPSTSATLSCSDNALCTSPSSYDLYCIDGNNDRQCTTDGAFDIIIQSVGVSADTSSGAPFQGYQLITRAYSATAFANSAPNLQILSRSTPNVRQQSAFSADLDSTAPLVQVVTDIVPAGFIEEEAYEDLCRRINKPVTGASVGECR